MENPETIEEFRSLRSLQDQMVENLSSHQNDKLEALIKEALQDQGVDTKDEFYPLHYVEKNCRVEIKDGVSTLINKGKAVCRWHNKIEPIKIDSNPLTTTITTNFYFQKLSSEN